MIKVNLQYTGLKKLNDEISIEKIQILDKAIREKTGAGSNFLGWLDWPENYDKNEYEAMKTSAKNLRNKIDVLLVIGIGGSYLGTRAAEEMIRGIHHNDKVKMIYIGNTMSSTYVEQVSQYLQNKNFGICVVSKSGTTTEPGIAFRVFEKQLIDQTNNNATNLIVAITDKTRGALKILADKKGYQTFVIPDDIGGRFSVLTPVGIYPLLVAGIDTDQIMSGAELAKEELSSSDLNNPAYQYAAARYILNTKYNYKTEALVSYELQMQYVNEWWKQLFGESEGKQNKGLLPSSMLFSTDLHSLGQWVQEGTRNIMFETVIKVKNPVNDINIPFDEANYDGLNYLSLKSFHEINSIAIEGVIDAHFNTGKMPNIVLEFETMNAKMFGYLVYFFELAVAMSGYLLEVNPFDQPGVEVYKNNMFKLLGKN